MTNQPIELASGRPVAPPAPETLEDLLGVEECVRYYPPDLSAVTEPDSVFRQDAAAIRKREIDLFVDVPFCRTICGFCPFNVYPYEAEKVRSYMGGLAKEIRRITALHDFDDVRITTVWVGGGTPTVMDERALDELLGLLSENFDLAELDEFSVEIKPTLENLADSKLAMLQRYGVGRISMGVQSTHADHLRVLGRGHTATDAFDVIRLIKDAGFALNIDMMYRLPGQTTAGVVKDIYAVNSLGIDHMSWFPYVPHEGTSLANRIDRGRVPQQAGRDEYFTMFQNLAERMAAAGYEQYTPYHFGLTGRCQYHLGRWGMPQRDTLGLGPGAFSFFNGWIYANEHDPARYRRTVDAGLPPVMRGKQLDNTERITRLAVLGIKLFSLDAEEFRRNSGVDLHEYYTDELALLQESGYLQVHPGGIECTLKGRAFNNDVATIFATDSARRTRHPQGIELMRLES